MIAPLPPSMQVQQRPDFANTGLWYDKFCNTWNAGWSMDAPAKLKWVKTVIGKKCGDCKLLDEHASRITALAGQHSGGALVFCSLYRFVSGMGKEHPIENGFAWHHTLGTPYLPGTSVKGMLRSYLTTWADRSPALEEVARIFGPHEDRNNYVVGSVIFLDAMPVEPVLLKADIMTPHYSPYYRDGNPPGDWHSPTPIPFLTVGEGAKFLFAVLPRTPRDKADCDTVLDWLAEALETTGAGAKTAIGYGRFQRDEKEEKELQRNLETAREQQAIETRRATLSLLAQELDRACAEGDWEKDKDRFTREGFYIEPWYSQLEADPQPDAVHLFCGLVERHYPGLLASPDKTQGKKNKHIFNENQRKFAHRLNAIKQQGKP